MNAKNDFHSELRRLCDEYVHAICDATDQFPKSEVFGTTSQLRRAALLVPLNYIEGYARGRDSYVKSFVEIAYGSLKESEYLIDFSHKRKYLNAAEYDKLAALADKIGGMLYGILAKLRS